MEMTGHVSFWEPDGMEIDTAGKLQGWLQMLQDSCRDENKCCRTPMACKNA